MLSPLMVASPAPPRPRGLESAAPLWRNARRELMRNEAAVGSMIVLAVIAALDLLAPWLSPHSYGARAEG
jgi:hypothetical protein